MTKITDATLVKSFTLGKEGSNYDGQIATYNSVIESIEENLRTHFPSDHTKFVKELKKELNRLTSGTRYTFDVNKDGKFTEGDRTCCLSNQPFTTTQYSGNKKWLGKFKKASKYPPTSDIGGGIGPSGGLGGGSLGGGSGLEDSSHELDTITDEMGNNNSFGLAFNNFFWDKPFNLGEKENEAYFLRIFPPYYKIASKSSEYHDISDATKLKGRYASIAKYMFQTDNLETINAKKDANGTKRLFKLKDFRCEVYKIEKTKPLLQLKLKGCDSLLPDGSTDSVFETCFNEEYPTLSIMLTDKLPTISANELDERIARNTRFEITASKEYVSPMMFYSRMYLTVYVYNAENPLQSIKETYKLYHASESSSGLNNAHSESKYFKSTFVISDEDEASFINTIKTSRNSGKDDLISFQPLLGDANSLNGSTEEFTSITSESYPTTNWTRTDSNYSVIPQIYKQVPMAFNGMNDFILNTADVDKRTFEFFIYNKTDNLTTISNTLQGNAVELHIGKLGDSSKLLKVKISEDGTNVAVTSVGGYFYKVVISVRNSQTIGQKVKVGNIKQEYPTGNIPIHISFGGVDNIQYNLPMHIDVL